MNHSTITVEQQASVAATLAGMQNIPAGVGSKENACSIAAINLALTGNLTDAIPECMSLVIGKWIIKIQDSAPAELRNSARWRRLLPLAAGTGRDKESMRISVVMEWMWPVVLPRLQPLADRHGFGESWQKMCDLRTAAAANAASADANATTYAANATTYAANAAAYAAYAAYATNAAKADANAAANYATYAATYAAYAAYADAAQAAADFWHSVDPCGCLERMINLPEGDRK